MSKTKEWIAAASLAVFVTPLNSLAQSPAACGSQVRYTISVHGGYVGEEHPNWPDAAVKELTRQIVARGRERLAAGAAALDVVVESIAAFENSGQTDAGKGSFENSAG